MVNNKYVLSAILSSATILISSCGIGKKNGENNRDIEVVVSPNLGVTAKDPNSVLYKSSQSSNSNVLKSLWVSSKAETAGLYRANGNGGLGVELNDKDSLEAYEGIKIDIKNDDKKMIPKITIEADGDIICKNLFSLDSINTVRINNVNLNGLAFCDLKITATGVKDGTAISESATIKIKLNLTMQDYASKSDTTYKYLETYSALNSPKLVAKWLKDSANGNRLNLRYDYNKAQIVGKKMVDTFALTGAQSLKSFDVSGSDVNDLRAIALLDNLTELDISKTKIDVKDLSLIADMKNLKNLSVREMGIKNFSTIVNYLSNIESLDISYNKNIEELNGISKLKNLRTLKAAGVGLKNLSEFKDANQVTSLDISDNDLSSLTKEDTQILVNMYNLTELNLSNTHIKDDVLDVLFEKLGTRNNIRKLVLRNKSNNGDISCDQINMVDNIRNIKKLTSLEYLDLHGNGCKRNSYGYFFAGLTDTNAFTMMHNLKYLDISATAVSDLSGIKDNFYNLTLKIFDVDDGGGIAMTKDGCSKATGNHPDCNKLRRGNEVSSEFNKAGQFSFKVPANVYKIKVSTCSGGDGGQGGQGGQGGTSGTLTHDESLGNDSGSITVCSWPGFPIMKGAFCWAPGAIGSSGNSGQQGQISKVTSENILIESTQETYYQNTNGFCGAGVGGSGGNSGGVHCGWWGHCNEAPQPQNGSTGSPGQNKKLITQEIEVYPTQVLNLLVGAGGAGGAGGSGGIFGHCASSDEGKLILNGLACAWRGQNGYQGGSGSDGYVKIEWLE